MKRRPSPQTWVTIIACSVIALGMFGLYTYQNSAAERRLSMDEIYKISHPNDNFISVYEVEITVALSILFCFFLLFSVYVYSYFQSTRGNSQRKRS